MVDVVGVSLGEKDPAKFAFAIGQLAERVRAGATIADNSVTYAKIQQVGASSLLGNPTGSLANVSEITLNATLSFTGTTLQRAALTGDVTASAGSNATTIANAAVTYAKMQNVSATSRFLGRITAGAGSPEELTGTQATTLLDAFTSSLKGLAPASGGGTTNFLRADGTWTTAGGFTAATQADQEAASSTAVGVTPGRQQFHPSASKAWARWNAAVSVAASYNVTSVTDNGAGDWTVNFTTSFSSANYGVAGTGGYAGSTELVFNVTAATAAGSCRVALTSVGVGKTDPDTPNAIWANFFGDQ